MEIAVFEAKVGALEGEVAEVMGVINAAHGRLVELMGRALDEELWKVWGIHSPGHWLGWQAGMSTGRAASVVKIAERRAELPTAVAALVAGELSVDSAIEVARRAPAAFEESITGFAKAATISQLQRSLSRYVYDDDTEKAKPKPREDDRSVSMGTDRNGWWLKGRLPADEGAVVEQAIRAARDDLYRQERAETPDGQLLGAVTWADGLLAVGEASLTVGEARFPGTDRYQVHLHLEPSLDPADPAGVLSLHLGGVVPAAVRARLLCDASVRPTYEADGIALSVGRRTRVISRRLRRAVEHRDGGCRVPGCGRTSGLEIHHIVHWEHGGGTDTANLCALCRSHHRDHHHGLLGVAGNPDRTDPGDERGLRFTDRWGHPLAPAGIPIAPGRSRTPTEAAAKVGLRPGAYRHPLGERLDLWSVSFSCTLSPRPGSPAAGPGAGSSSDPREGGPPSGTSPPEPAA